MNSFISWFKDFMDKNGVKYQTPEPNSFYVPVIDITFTYTKLGKKVDFCNNSIHIWEDWWQFKPEIVKSRVISKLGLLYRVPARLTEMRRINAGLADMFLIENHLQGKTNSKIKYGLFLPEKYFRVLDKKPAGDELLVAVMTFSGKRTFRDGSASYELLRFCTLNAFSVQGGFSKLLQHFIEEKNPDSIMTYADLDWSPGQFYEDFGFVNKEFLVNNLYKLDESGKRVQVSSEFEAEIVNRGSLKMIWTKES